FAALAGVGRPAASISSIWALGSIFFIELKTLLISDETDTGRAVGAKTRDLTFFFIRMATSIYLRISARLGKPRTKYTVVTPTATVYVRPLGATPTLPSPPLWPGRDVHRPGRVNPNRIILEGCVCQLEHGAIQIFLALIVFPGLLPKPLTKPHIVAIACLQF